MFAWFKGKSFEEQINEFQTKLNLIATSLVKSSEENIEEGNYDLAQLQDLNVCNEYVIFLGNELEKRFKKVDVEDIADTIYIGKRQKKSQTNNKNNKPSLGMNNLDIDNYSVDKEKHTKKEICIKIASHFIRILNLISSILTAVNPQKNMCSRRLEALYKITEKDVESGYVKTCHADDTDKTNPLYPNNINDIPGIKQLLNLYYFYLAQDIDYLNEKQVEQMQDEYNKLVESFSNVFFSVDDEFNTNNLNMTSKNNQESTNTIDETLTDLKTIKKNNKTNRNNELTQKVDNLTELLKNIKAQLNQTQSKPQQNQINIEQLKSNLSTSIKEQLGTISTTFEGQIQEIKEEVSKIKEETQLTKEKTLEESKEPEEETYETFNESNEELNKELNKNNQENTKLNQELNKILEDETEIISSRQIENQLSKSSPEEIVNSSRENNKINSPKINQEEPVNSSQLQNQEPEEPEEPINSSQILNVNTTKKQNGGENKKLVLNSTNNLSKNTNTNTTNTNTNTTNNINNLNNHNSPNDINTNTTNTTNNNTNTNTTNNINNLNNHNSPNDINNINNNLIAQQQSTQEAKTNIDKFLQFADKYKKDYKIPENLLLKLRTKKVSEIVSLYTCSKNPSKTTIQINSDGYSDFKKSYQKLKQHYLDSTTSLLGIMENKLLDKTNDNNNTQYKIKNITDKQLNNIQIEVMTELTNYYTNCQTYYEESFQILANSLTPEELYNNI